MASEPAAWPGAPLFIDPPGYARHRPEATLLYALVERLADRIGRALERQGLLARDAESSYLELDAAAGGPLDDLIGHSITYRVAVGPRAGQKVFSLRTVPVTCLISSDH
jgi:hypothetical protein